MTIPPVMTTAAPANGHDMLRPQHMDHLTGFRIPPQMLEAADVESVTDTVARELLGLKGHQGADLSGILFPYNHPQTSGRVGGRIRLDHLLPDGSKYISEPGCRHLFFPPDIGHLLQETSVPVILVEAEKSALAVQALADRAGRKLLVIAVGGCWGWRRKTGKRALPNGNSEPETGPSPDFDLIAWAGRTAILVFDSNALTNSDVRRARWALAQELAGRGASLLIAEMPDINGINGPDDLIAASGDVAMLLVLDSVRLFAECAVTGAEQALSEIQEDKNTDPLPVIDAISTIEDVTHRVLLIGRLAALKVPGANRKFIEQQVGRRRAEAEVNRKRVTEAARNGRLVAMNVNGSDLVVQVENYFSQRVWQMEHAPLVESLFTMLTYCLEQFSTVPYLCFESATPGCGKSTCLDLLKAVVARPLYSAGLSRAVLVRQLDERRVTLLLDESEWLSARSETADAIRGILHAVTAVAQPINSAKVTITRCVTSKFTGRRYSPRFMDSRALSWTGASLSTWSDCQKARYYSPHEKRIWNLWPRCSASNWRHLRSRPSRGWRS